MAERIAAAFAAGLVSIAFPCVLPARARLPLGDLGGRGRPARASGESPGGSSSASVPFALGFTVVFVVLGAAAAALGGWVDPRDPDEDRRLRARRSRPGPGGPAALAGADAGAGRDRPRAGERLAGAARRGVRRLRRAVRRGRARRRSSCSPPTRAPWCAAASCSPPTRSGSRSRSSLIGIAFAHAMTAFRWVRDHYDLDPLRRAASRWSCSACCSSSTATGG